jgi:hypothetical protein
MGADRKRQDLVALIDSLKSQGVGEWVDLPQLVVYGDQSS